MNGNRLAVPKPVRNSPLFQSIQRKCPSCPEQVDGGMCDAVKMVFILKTLAGSSIPHFPRIPCAQELCVAFCPARQGDNCLAAANLTDEARSQTGMNGVNNTARIAALGVPDGCGGPGSIS